MDQQDIQTSNIFNGKSNINFVPASPESYDRGDLVSFTEDEFKFSKPDKEMAKLRQYIREQGISPLELIELHKKSKATN